MPVSYIRHPYEDELTAVKAESCFFFRLRLVTRKFHVLAVQNYDKEVYKVVFFFANKIYRFVVFLLPFSLPCRCLDFLFL